jgi:hypothetical protein
VKNDKIEDVNDEHRRDQALDNAPDWADPEARIATREARKENGETGRVVGICVSGGGIRSAAFGLGVLSALEEPG